MIRKAKSFLEENVLSYAVIGTLPGRWQEKYAEKHHKESTFYCKYSLAAVAATIGIRYIIGENANDYQYLHLPGNILKHWAEISVIANTARLGLVIARKKPLGDLLFMELPYALGITTKKMIKILKKHKMEYLLENPKNEEIARK